MRLISACAMRDERGHQRRDDADPDHDGERGVTPLIAPNEKSG